MSCTELFCLPLLRRERSKVPYIVRQCVEEIERRGMEEVGIYRVSGVATDIQALKAAFDVSKYLCLLSSYLWEPVWAPCQMAVLFLIYIHPRSIKRERFSFKENRFKLAACFIHIPQPQMRPKMYDGIDPCTKYVCYSSQQTWHGWFAGLAKTLCIAGSFLRGSSNQKLQFSSLLPPNY